VLGRDEGLPVCPALRTLSLRRCAGVGDEAVGALALTSPELREASLKGTAITDTAVRALLDSCPRLQRLEVDSCRGVSRALRLEMARGLGAASASVAATAGEEDADGEVVSVADANRVLFGFDERMAEERCMTVEALMHMSKRQLARFGSKW